MRSVFVCVRTATTDEVEAFLGRNYPFQAGPPWIDAVNGDPCLYINVYSFEQVFDEPDDRRAIVQSLGGRPSATVMADISGRHPGDEQVRRFVAAVLTNFSGVAQDEYARHCWTLDEILSDTLVEGHPYFDYCGWYEAKKS